MKAVLWEAVALWAGQRSLSRGRRRGGRKGGWHSETGFRWARVRKQSPNLNFSRRHPENPARRNRKELGDRDRRDRRCGEEQSHLFVGADGGKKNTERANALRREVREATGAQRWGRTTKQWAHQAGVLSNLRDLTPTELRQAFPHSSQAIPRKAWEGGSDQPWPRPRDFHTQPGPVQGLPSPSRIILNLAWESHRSSAACRPCAPCNVTCRGQGLAGCTFGGCALLSTVHDVAKKPFIVFTS